MDAATQEEARLRPAPLEDEIEEEKDVEGIVDTVMKVRIIYVK